MSCPKSALEYVGTYQDKDGLSAAQLMSSIKHEGLIYLQRLSSARPYRLCSRRSINGELDYLESGAQDAVHE
jgi:hypothetical protein